jgi:chaperonin GroES
MTENTEAGSIMELAETPAPDVQDTDDGGAIVAMSQERQVAGEVEFYANIADALDQDDLDALCTELLQKVEYDRESRKKRDKQYEEGLRRTGLGEDAPGGANFQGASRVVHPMLTESCVDFSSRAIRELFPADGPARDYIPGTATKARVAKAQRKTKYLNWQCKVQMQEFRSELEQLLTQTPLAGVGYLRIVYDAQKKRPVPTFVPVDDIYLPYAASSFYTAERTTFVEYITEYEFDKRVADGIYRDIEIAPPGTPPELTKPEKANQKIEGKQEEVYNSDGLRTMLEITVYAELESEYGMAPYRISIEPNGKAVAAVVRNWEQADDTKQCMWWMSEWPFVPWRGAYPIGLSHMIGSLAGGATGALRALLDTAHINNIPTLLKLRGTNFSGQSLELNVTQVTEVEGAIATDDIRKLMMPVPFNPPSATLFSLLGFLVDSGKGVIQTTFEKFSESSNANMPVGTTLALIEQGMQVFSAIHARMHEAMARTLGILHRINRMYLTDEDVRDETGELMVKRSDFEGPLDVIPVSDPEIFSDIQRFAQMQVVAQRAQMNPLYDQRKVELMILQQTRIPDAENLLVPAPTAEPMNAVNENLAMTFGRPVAAFPDQDHLAHIQVLLDFMTSPVLGSLPVIAPTYLPAALQHLKEHVVLWYVNHIYETVSAEAGTDLGGLMKFRDPETRKELDKTLAIASSDAAAQAPKTFASLPAVIQRAQQVLESFGPPTPQDPASQAKVATAQIAATSKREQIQARTQEVQMTLAADAQRDAQRTQTDIQRDAMKQQNEDKRAQMTQQMLTMREGAKQENESARQVQELAARERMNTADNVTALTIAEAETLADNKAAVETGTGINPNP